MKSIIKLDFEGHNSYNESDGKEEAMLCQFSFQNFKSYKGETTFDFQAVAIPEFAESLLTCKVETKENKEIKGASLLPVGVVYGWIFLCGRAACPV